MTTRMPVAALASALGALAVAGCGTPARLGWHPEPIDEARVAAVNKAASRAGVRVIWVNPPTTTDSARAGRAGG